MLLEKQYDLMAQPMLSDGGQHKTNSRVFWEDFSQNAPSGLFKNKNKKNPYWSFAYILWFPFVFMGFLCVNVS